MANVPLFFWKNIITVVVLGILLLPVLFASSCLILGIFFRDRTREAGVHLALMLVLAGYWAASAWNPPLNGCDHTEYCWQYPAGAGLLFAQLLWLLYRFLYVEQEGGSQEMKPPKG